LRQWNWQPDVPLADAKFVVALGEVEVDVFFVITVGVGAIGRDAVADEMIKIVHSCCGA
jgi:hypothetical protein